MTYEDYYNMCPPVITLAEPTHYGSHASKLLADAGHLDLAHAMLLRVVTMQEAAEHLTTLRRAGLLSLEGQHAECKLWDWVYLDHE